MTPYEEFEALCNKQDTELASEDARQSAFINSLKEALIDLSIQLFPEVEAHKDKFIKDLRLKAHERANNLNEMLDSMAAGFSYEEIIKGMDMTVPPGDVSEEEEEDEAIDSEFVFKCHDKAKEMIWNYFPELVDFPANSIRYLNFSSYLEMDEWTDDFYHCTDEYMNDADLD